MSQPVRIPGFGEDDEQSWPAKVVELKRRVRRGSEVAAFESVCKILSELKYWRSSSVAEARVPVAPAECRIGIRPNLCDSQPPSPLFCSSWQQYPFRRPRGRKIRQRPQS